MRHLVLFLFLFASLKGEVEQVQLFWNPIPCILNCPILLRERLQKAKGVETVDVNAKQGIATMTWAESIPFSFVPLNYALRWVGVREKALRVRVSGVIYGAGSNYFIKSRGDGTVFVLLNRALPVGQNDYTVLFSAFNRILTPDLIATLEEIKRSGQIAVIEGPIFMPERSPPDPLRLVIENISVEKEEEIPPPPPAEREVGGSIEHKYK